MDGQKSLDFEGLVNSVIEKAGYSTSELSKPHLVKIQWRKRKVLEQTINEGQFLLTRHYRSPYNHVSIKYLDNTIQLEQEGQNLKMTYKEGNKKYERKQIASNELEKLTQQVCTLLCINQKSERTN